MDQAEALPNLQPRRSTRTAKPTKHPDFLYSDADFLNERTLFSQHQSPFTDPSKQDASGGWHFRSIVQPATEQSNKQSKRSKKSLKTESGLPYEADLQRQLYDLQLRDEQAELLTSPPAWQVRSTKFSAASCYWARSQPGDSFGAVAEGKTHPGIRSTSAAPRPQFCFRWSPSPSIFWGKVHVQKKASDRFGPTNSHQVILLTTTRQSLLNL